MSGSRDMSTVKQHCLLMPQAAGTTIRTQQWKWSQWQAPLSTRKRLPTAFHTKDWIQSACLLKDENWDWLKRTCSLITLCISRFMCTITFSKVNYHIAGTFFLSHMTLISSTRWEKFTWHVDGGSLCHAWYGLVVPGPADLERLSLEVDAIEGHGLGTLIHRPELQAEDRPRTCWQLKFDTSLISIR